MNVVQKDSILTSIQNIESLDSARTNLIPKIDTLTQELKKDSAEVVDSEYKGNIASSALGDSQIIAQEFQTFLENTNVDELFTEAALIEGRLMQGVDIGWLEHSPFAPPTPGNYPNITDPSGIVQKAGSADRFGGYFGLSGDDPKLDYGYTMGVVSEADVYNPFWIDKNMTHSWPAEPQRAYILPENDPALYENYMNYLLTTNEDGTYVHDQEVVDQALAYKQYLTLHDNLQNIVHDTYFFDYDMPHFILPNQPGTRTQLIGDERFPDVTHATQPGQSLWDLPKFQTEEFRAEHGSKSGAFFSPFEFHDIVEKLEAAPPTSAIGKAYADYLNILNQAQGFVSSAQGMYHNDLKRYTQIRELLDYKGKGFGEGDVSHFGLGRDAQYQGDREKGFTYSGFQTLEQYSGQGGTFPFYDSEYLGTADDYRTLQKYPQDLVNILVSLKELE